MCGPVAVAFNPLRRPHRGDSMRRTAATLPVIASALLLAACSSPATTASSPPASPAASQASSPAAPASAAGSAAATQSAAPTSLDPCQLVTSSEASALAGTTFGPGQEEASGQGGKRCVYGSQTTNVFMVEVGQAASPAAARRGLVGGAGPGPGPDQQEAARRDQPVRAHPEDLRPGRPRGPRQRLGQRRRADDRPERHLPPQGGHLPRLPGRSARPPGAGRSRHGGRGPEGPGPGAVARTGLNPAPPAAAAAGRRRR